MRGKDHLTAADAAQQTMKSILLFLVLLSGCRTAQSTIEVQAVVGQGEPQIHVVAKMVMP